MSEPCDWVIVDGRMWHRDVILAGLGPSGTCPAPRHDRAVGFRGDWPATAGYPRAERIETAPFDDRSCSLFIMRGEP